LNGKDGSDEESEDLSEGDASFGSAPLEGAPENEPAVQAAPHKRNLTASDVEPLKQRLLNMRRQRQMD
uniref:RFXK protein n=1 Tax=Toxocara canis TaxID=6265 RepID=A0A183U4Z7_TOXCA